MIREFCFLVRRTKQYYSSINVYMINIYYHVVIYIIFPSACPFLGVGDLFRITGKPNN
jgi:hypothetical protein